MADAELVELPRALVNEFAAVGEKQHPRATLNGRTYELGGHDGLPASGRRDQDDTLRAAGDGPAQLVNHAMLVGA